MNNSKEQTGKQERSADPQQWLIENGLNDLIVTQLRAGDQYTQYVSDAIRSYAKPLQQRISELESQIQDLEPKFTELEMDCKRLKAELKRKDEALRNCIDFLRFYDNKNGPIAKAADIAEQALKPKTDEQL